MLITVKSRPTEDMHTAGRESDADIRETAISSELTLCCRWYQTKDWSWCRAKGSITTHIAIRCCCNFLKTKQKDRSKYLWDEMIFVTCRYRIDCSAKVWD
jgi:hypothetical protein